MLSFYPSFSTSHGGIRTLEKNLGKLAQLRRLYHHMQYDGKLHTRDNDYITGCISYYNLEVRFDGTKKSLSNVISEIEKAHT